MAGKIIFTISLGVLLLWLSLFFSYQELPNAYGDIREPIATGGFPLKVFEYPVPPMGNNWPPTQSWPPFLVNLAIWLFVGFLISLLINKKLKNKKLIKLMPILAIFVSVLGLFYVILKFD